MQYTAANLLVRPKPAESERIVDIAPARAGWELLAFQVRRLETGATWTGHTGGCEAALINLTGSYTISSKHGKWKIGRASCRERVCVGV
mgnify:CR=1 FL=1